MAADETSRTLNAFLRFLSHEIRGPVGAMLGYAEMVGDYCQTDEERRSYLHRLRESGMTLLDLLGQVVDLSNADVGMLHLEPIAFSLRQLLREVAAAKTWPKEIRLEPPSLEGVADVVHTDPARLKQILLGVVENAIEVAGDGAVVLRVGREEDPGGRSRLEVRVEMESAALGTDWARSRAWSFPAEEAGATGGGTAADLKLALARKLARLLGGDVVASAAPPAFVVSVASGAPIDEQAAQGPSGEVPATPCDLRGKRILVADDSADCREPLVKLLSRRGATVEAAENGFEAVEKASAAPYDVILMDLRMPIVSGYKATRNLRRKGIKTPVIAISGRTSPEERAESLDAGCDAFLAKPFESGDLVSLIRRVAEADARG